MPRYHVTFTHVGKHRLSWNQFVTVTSPARLMEAIEKAIHFHRATMAQEIEFTDTPTPNHYEIQTQDAIIGAFHVRDAPKHEANQERF